VIVDLSRQRVLFAVPTAEAAGQRKVSVQPKRFAEFDQADVSESWRAEVRHRNERALKTAHAESVWIDVTKRWDGFSKLFATIARAADERPGVIDEGAPAFSARMFGMEHTDELMPEFQYFERGFVEVASSAANWAEVAQVHSFEGGRLVSRHTFVPIPGTTWVVETSDSGAPVIVRRETVLKRHRARFPDGTIVRYFRRGSSSEMRRSLAQSPWLPLLERNRHASEIRHLKRWYDVPSARREAKRRGMLDAYPKLTTTVHDRIWLHGLLAQMPNRRGELVTNAVQYDGFKIRIDVSSPLKARWMYATLLRAVHLLRVEAEHRPLAQRELLQSAAKVRGAGPWSVRTLGPSGPSGFEGRFMHGQLVINAAPYAPGDIDLVALALLRYFDLRRP
jgi:hypothetical protein